MTPKPLNIYFHCLDAAGHIGACTGFAQPLARRGHQITFLVSRDNAGKFAKYSFNEIILEPRPAPQPEKPQPNHDGEPVNTVKVFAEMLLQMGLLSGKSSLEKLKRGEIEFVISLYETMVHFDPQIGAAIEKGKPDVFVLDHFLVSPALLKSRVPWIHLYSSNPLALYDTDKLPPYGSGRIRLECKLD